MYYFGDTQRSRNSSGNLLRITAELRTELATEFADIKYLLGLCQFFLDITLSKHNGSAVHLNAIDDLLTQPQRECNNANDGCVGQWDSIVVTQMRWGLEGETI